MLNLAFVATLVSLLPSFLGVAVKTGIIGPSFRHVSKDIPVIWSDGEVRLQDGKVVISVGEKSTLMVYSQDEITGIATIHKFVCNVKETVKLSEPNIHVTITTKKEEDHSEEAIDKNGSVNDVLTLKIIEPEPVIGIAYPEKSIKTKDVLKSTESHQRSDLQDQGQSEEVINNYSSFEDLVTLNPIEREPVVKMDYVENFINTEDAFNGTKFRKVSDLDLGSILASENTIEDDSETKDLLDLINDDIPSNMNVIGLDTLDTLIEETEGNNDQDSLRNNPVDAEVQRQLVEKSVKGEQFKIARYKEPIIYASNGIVKKPQFANSLTGKIFQTATNRKPFTGEYRIPDDTKMLILNEGDHKKYYKNITLGSKVWYLRRDEKVFYPCFVEKFSVRNKKPTLLCIGHELERVVKVSWYDIFPFESAEMIKDLGEFVITNEDINWGKILKEKENDITLPEEQEKPGNCRALPQKRKIMSLLIMRRLV